MKNKIRLLIAFHLLLSTFLLSAHAQGTAFTYQGRLNSGSAPANGSYDVAFTLYGVNAGGSGVAGPVTNVAVAVSNGLFTTTVDLGNAFTGADRWLELAVRTNGNGAFTTLAPRQPLTPTPYSVFAGKAASATTATTAGTAGSAGSVTAANITGALTTSQLPAGVIINGASGVNLSGTFSGNGAGLTGIYLQQINTSGAITLLNHYLGFVLSSTPGVGSAPISVTSADVNGDGKPDLISANYYGGNLTVLTNNGNGGFVLSSSPVVGLHPWSVVAADVNGDGKPDLICANYDGGNLTVLTNNGSGGFGLSSTLAVASNPNCVIAVDVNGDGKLDLVAANNDAAGNVTIYTNNGTGGFALAPSPVAGSYLSAVTAADVNGDGKVDLIAANYNAHKLTVMTNNGAGIFVVAAQWDVGNSPYSLTAADVNGDGKPDLISGNYSDNTLTVLTNNGSGGFALASSPGVGNSPYWVTAADVNGDGKLDLISANYGASSLTVLTNDGSGGFGLDSTLGVGSYPHSVVAADVNGDGRPDLICANFGSGTLTVWTNSSSRTASFNGNGSGLTGLNASSLVGTLATAQLPASVITNGAASGFHATAMGADTFAGGRVSTAMGDSTIASGDFSTAMGESTTASGNYSTAMGAYTVASGNYSTAMGDFTFASGDFSTTMGAATVASGKYSIAAGYYSQATNQGDFVWADSTSTTPFASTANNQFLIRATGGMGINKNNPATALDVNGTVTATGFTGNGAGLTGLNASSLVGTLATAQLPASVITNGAASGFHATAMGADTFAGGRVSTAMGDSTIASGDFSTAMGESTTASGNYSTAMGAYTVASGNYSTAMGDFTFASGDFSTTMGAATVASGKYSIAAGYYSQATNQGDFVWADSTSTTPFASTANNQFLIRAIGGMGINKNNPATALDVNGTVTATGFSGSGAGLTGLNAANLTGTILDAQLSSNVALRSGGNAFTGNQSIAGTLGIGTTSPQGSLHVYSVNNPTVMRLQSSGTPGFGRLEFVSNPQGDANEWRPGYIQSSDNGGFTGGLAFFVNGSGAGSKFGNTEVMRVVNGAVGIGTTTPVSALQVVGTVTATAFNPPSDRNLKENFTPVNPRDVLDKVAAMPITHWNFIGDAATPHVGPMAQDFHAAFGLGTDERHIATVDADGVALAAIQGLNQKLEQKETEITELKQRLDALEKIIHSQKTN